MGIKIIDDKSHGEVTAKEGYNYRIPYEHQKSAMHKMDDMNKKDSFSTTAFLKVEREGGFAYGNSALHKKING